MATEKQQAQAQLLMLKGAISELTPDEQTSIRLLADTYRESVKKAGAMGILAFTLVGMEMQVEATE